MTVLPIVAIDGPAGTGKSTVSRGVAAALGWECLDTGAMYRAMALAILNAGIALDDEPAIASVIDDTEIVVGERVRINGQDVTDTIRAPETTTATSMLASLPFVRARLIARQRAWVAERGRGVVEGRDITSVVLPDAAVRIYLYAVPEIRAQRRGEDESVAHRARTTEVIAGELELRDARDSTLGRIVRLDQVPQGVTVIDTSLQSAADVIAQIVAMYRAWERHQ
ncbi:MAG: (d)CMP kinase [Acidimicrobiia bacterium]